MAEFDVSFPDDFLGKLLGTDFGEIAGEALEEAVPVLEKSMKESCRRVLEHGEGSELVESIQAGKPKRTKTDAWIVNVTPKGYSSTKLYRGTRRKRKDRVPNTQKMMAKEYGVAGRQPARPFLANACNNARDEVLGKLQETYSRKVAGDGNQ